MRPNPVGSADIRETMVRFVMEGSHAFIESHSQGLFGQDCNHPGVIDTIAEGLAQAIHRYGKQMGQPLAQAVAIHIIKESTKS